ncbi:hypothetical protein BSKO_07407 [Bryopsis sp. KO-2023]|nr:hypothetical protein BSKO_07407 [Bryopsis sp. KO-2023]
MHPFWLTFWRTELEREFARHNANRKLKTDYVCLLLTLAVELAVLCTVMLKSHGILGKGFWAHLVCVLGPQAVGVLCHRMLPSHVLEQHRTLIVFLTKLSYTPFAVFASTYKNPSPDQVPWSRYDTTNTWELAFNDAVGLPILIAVASEVFGNSMAAFGLTMKFKHQFFFQITGCCLSIWEQQGFISEVLMFREEGKVWVKSFTDRIELISNYVWGVMDMTGSYAYPIDFPCQSLLAFLQLFCVGFLCLSVVWVMELYDRESFLTVWEEKHPEYRKECRNESFFAEEGQEQLELLWKDFRVQVIAGMVLLNGFALCWKSWLALCYHSTRLGVDGWLTKHEVW